MMITNFQACPLGLSLRDRMKNLANYLDYDALVLVGPNAQKYEDKEDSKLNYFDAFVNEEEDRNRLMAYLKDNG